MSVHNQSLQVGRTSGSAFHQEVSLKPYPAYKDSGVPWLGDVPAHWELHRAKYLFRYNKDLNTNGEETNILSLTLRGVVNNDPNNPEGLVPKDYSTYQRFKAGDLVFKLIDLENRQTSRVGLVHEDGIMSPAYVRLIPNAEIAIRYFYHQFFDLYLRRVFNQLGSGVRSTLGPNDLLNLYLSVPPPDEQRAIAAFLDHHDRLTRRYVHAQQRLIKLLTEQKQALIQQAVTRGLDPDAPLKDSGIEWLPKIPEHWKAIRLGVLASSLQTGPFGSQLHSYEYQPNGVPVINPSHMKDGKIIPDVNCAISSIKVEQLSRHRLQAGDIIFARRGELGRCALVTHREEGWLCGTGSLRVRLKDAIASNPEYLVQLFLSKDVGKWLSLQSIGSTMENLNTGILARLPFPLPPESEQEAIVKYIATQQGLVDSAINRAQRQIALVREYRARLIADVVTGKLDVRGFEVGCTSESTSYLDDLDGLADTENLEDTISEIEEPQEEVNE